MDNNLRLEGKVAAITGGASGIGRETALLFKQHGAKIALLDIDRIRLEEVKAEGESEIEIFPTDITNEDDVMKTFSHIEKVFGKLDVLVNCAGIYAPGKADQTDFDTWKKVLGVNLDGAFLCSKYAVKVMKKNGGGSIINVASEAGIAAIAGQVAYNVSKAGMISMSQSMGVDYALENIRVNCVCPGRVLTPLVQNIIDASDDPKKAFEDSSFDRPMMRMGKPIEIAHACLNFADDSMLYATGAVFSIDGGYTAR